MAGQGNYPAGFTGTPYDVAPAPLPDEFRVALDGMELDGISIPLPGWIVLETATQYILRYETDELSEFAPPAWLEALVTRWLATKEGQKDIQFWLDRAVQ